MANAEQLARLMTSVKDWNQYIQTRNDVERIDLSNANLSNSALEGARLAHAELTQANLRGAYLAYADLSNANLNGADLSYADLTNANLSGADLSCVDFTQVDAEGVDLSGANLFRGYLWHANLSGGNLSSANLMSANLQNAKLLNCNLKASNLTGAAITLAELQGADLTKAMLSATMIGGSDLTGAIGLGTCIFDSKSFLDQSTIARSSPLPVAFLRGCGLPENLITYLPTLLNQPIQFYSCFISYSTNDQPFAERLHADLQDKGVRCWFAPHDIVAGKKIHEQIDEAIRVHDKLLLILSEDSMKSRWVQTEIAKARKREVTDQRRMLFPVSLVGFKSLQEWKCLDAESGADLAAEIREIYIPDFSQWAQSNDAYKRALKDLLRNLNTSEGNWQ